MDFLVYILIVLVILSIVLYIVFTILPIPQVWKNVITAIILLVFLLSILNRQGYIFK